MILSLIRFAEGPQLYNLVNFHGAVYKKKLFYAFHKKKNIHFFIVGKTLKLLIFFGIAVRL